MATNDSPLSDKVADYYSGKIRQHGVTPAGVDWNGDESQLLRFSQLSKVISADKTGLISVADLGCGYGALYDYLSEHHQDLDYRGYDLSAEMCEAAEKHLSGRAGVSIYESGLIDQEADYGLASGIFNVKLDTTSQDWYDYIVEILDNLNSQSVQGFAFNCLTSFSDEDRMRDYLYYASPTKLFDLCKTKYSNNVALLHDYELYEFTILVRK